MKRRYTHLVLAVVTMACTSNMAQTASACHAKQIVPHAVTQAGAKDRFVVETVGKNCADARLLVSLETAEGRIYPLVLEKLANFGEQSTSDQQGAVAAVKEAASRIDSSMQTPLESWADLEKAGTQPEGAPWRGTPLTRAEYERLLKLKPRSVIVPTDFTRNKLVVWDPHGSGRPVDFVYYGD